MSQFGGDKDAFEEAVRMSPNDREHEWLKNGDSDPFKPALARVWAAGTASQESTALIYIAKPEAGTERAISHGIGPGRTEVGCELSPNGEGELHPDDSRCVAPTEVNELTGTYDCLGGVKLKVETGANIYVVQKAEFVYGDDELPFLNREHVTVDGEQVFGPIAVHVYDSQKAGARPGTGSITVGHAKNCQIGSRGGDPKKKNDDPTNEDANKTSTQKVNFWVSTKMIVVYVVVGVLVVAIAAYVVCMQSEDDSDDDDDDDYTSSSSEEESRGRRRKMQGP
jgi:hypothetical protein